MKAKRNSILAATVVAVLATTSGIAAAKDLCWTVNANRSFKFFKVKALKPGSAVALNGILLSSGGSHPASGAATMNAAGTTVRVGVFVHSLNLPTSSNNYTEEAQLDSELFGSGFYDSDGDFQTNGATTWVPVDCKTLTIP